MAHLRAMGYARTDKGEHFTEGSRLLWSCMMKRDLSLRAAATAAGVSRAALHRWLYGDQVPSVTDASKLADTFGIPMNAWAKGARHGFTLPAARSARPAA
jgi:transcriptional regulator with XRE-family HTH domain